MGITNVVATRSTSITEEQMNLLAKEFKTVLHLTHSKAKLPFCKEYCQKSNMRYYKFDVDQRKNIQDFITENEMQIKDKIDYFEAY